MIDSVDGFAAILADAKRRAAVDFEWYPYDSLANAQQINRLLEASAEPVLEHAHEYGILDLGCADGDLAFLFESLGFQVTAVDNPVTSHNHMRGVRTLKDRLGSNIDLHELDIDAQFALPEKHYGLGIVLGLLYHLKNPFYLLETLARRCDYVMLSTRVARRLPDGTELPERAPLAYLLDTYELNDDNSNYWIFSEIALRRLFQRTRWECRAYFTVGDSEYSDPVNPQHDERAFVLLKSHFGLGHLELLAGWYEPQSEGWRWTAREFALRVPAARAADYRRIIVRLYAPPVLLERLGPLQLRATAGGHDLTPAAIGQAGSYVFDRPVRMTTADSVVSFSLDKFLPAGDPDPRELGIVVESVEFE